MGVLVLLVFCPQAFAAYVYVANSTAPGTISQFSVAADGTHVPLSRHRSRRCADGTSFYVANSTNGPTGNSISQTRARPTGR